MNLGVTSGGDFYGNTQITFTDVLGDKQFSFFAQSVSAVPDDSRHYVNIRDRMQYALQGFSQDQFYYGRFTDVLRSGLHALFLIATALAKRSQRGGTAFGIYPFNRYARLELFGGYIHYTSGTTIPSCRRSDDYPGDSTARPLFRNGT